MDGQLLRQLERLAEAVTGVERAAAILTHEPAAERFGSAIAPTQPDLLPRRETVSVPSRLPAEAHGDELIIGPNDPRTLQQCLARAAAGAGGRGTVYIAPDGTVERQTYTELLHEAQSTLAGLRALGLRPGDPVLFQFDRNRALVTALWACVLGGFVGTPVGVPPSYSRENAALRKLRNAWELLARPVVLTDRTLREEVAGLNATWGERLRVEMLEELVQGPEDRSWFPAQPGDAVVHLLTSGSTGVPKCVRHTHESVLARTQAATIMNGFNELDVTVNWMPLDHVSIVMYNVRDVFLGCEHVNAKAQAFAADPLAWLDWIDRYRGTNTWAPNFAFALVNEREDEVRRRRWDLSCMVNICNAAETIVAQTAHRFLRLLAAHGLPSDAMRPCWGMSETCSGVTYSCLSRDDRAVGTLTVSKDSLSGDLDFRDRGTPDTVELVDVGRPIAGFDMRVVDDDDRLLPEGRIGNLQVRGAPMLREYYDNPAANAASITRDGWFRTGDLAFLMNGRLIVTGRKGDVIVINGLNYLNHEIELIVERVDGVEPTLVAACAMAGETQGSDRLVVFFVPTSPDPYEHRRVVSVVRSRLAFELGLDPHLVVPVSANEFPKTTSGKIQRGQLVSDLRSGAFDQRLAMMDEAGSHGAFLPGFYERVWREVPPSDRGGTGPGVWVLIDDGNAGELVAALHAAGRDVEVVRRGRGPEVGADRWRELLLAVRHARGEISTVVHALALNRAEPPLLDIGAAAEQRTVELVSILTASASVCPAAEVLVVTVNGAWTGLDQRLDCVHAPLPGLVRSARAEGMLVRLIDLTAGELHRCAEALVTEAGTTAEDAQVAYRGGRRLVPRLRRASRPVIGRTGIETGGVYLMTGGLGGVGHILAQYLLAAHDVRLLVCGRTRLADSPVAAERLAELTDLGNVTYVSADVADLDQLSNAVHDMEARWRRPLTGVLHLAGASIADQWRDLERHVLVRENPDAFREAFRAKVHGTLALARILSDRPSAGLVLFSSVNGYFGARMYGAYAAASSFLDGFAAYWGRVRGRPVRCLAWSMWSGVGMNRDGATAAAAVRRGFRPIEPDQGLATFLAALGREEDSLLIGLDDGNIHVASELDPENASTSEVLLAFSAPAGVRELELRAKLRTALPDGVRLRLCPVPEIRTNGSGGIDHDHLLDLLSLPPHPDTRGGSPETDLERTLARIWQDVLHRPVTDREDNFFRLGGNSLQTAQLVARINAELGTDISPRQIYDCPSVRSLACVLSPELREV